MKVEELRIGNWVIDYVTGEAGKILQINHVDNDIYLGIPLTPEILVKAGFACFNGKWKHNAWLPFLIERKHGIWQVFNVADCQICYLHQLQNLFALTNFGNEELNITL